jgi:membrane-associated protease RseP (regulator of RpoE activity)
MNKKFLSLLVAAALACSAQVVFADTKTVEPESGKEVTKAATAEQQSQYSWLGVAIEPVPMVLAKHFSGMLKENQGIMVRLVKPNSPAAKAGLKPFDVISGFNDQEIYTMDQFSHLIRSTKPGTVVKIRLIRQSQPQTLEVTLEAKPGMQRMHHPRRHMPYVPFSSPHGFNQMPSPQDWHGNRSSFKNRFNQPGRQVNSWSEFESVQVESTGPDQYKASVKYEDSDGNKQDFIFEGKMNEIYKQIKSHKTMSEDKKRSLLQALDMTTAPPVMHPWQALPDPGWFRHNQLPIPPGYRFNY